MFHIGGQGFRPRPYDHACCSSSIRYLLCVSRTYSLLTGLAVPTLFHVAGDNRFHRWNVYYELFVLLPLDHLTCTLRAAGQRLRFCLRYLSWFRLRARCKSAFALLPSWAFGLRNTFLAGKGRSLSLPGLFRTIQSLLKLANLFLKLGNHCVSLTQLAFQLGNPLVTRIHLCCV